MLIKATPEVKFGLIREMTSRDDNLLNITWLCEIAGVSRSGYYRWLDTQSIREEREERDQADFALILEAYQHRGYNKGARGIYMRLLHRKPPVIMNLKKIRRLILKYKLKCPIPKANPYRRMAKALKTSHVAPNLLNREFCGHGARAVLLTDITYIPRKEGGFSYLSTILDAYTRQLLSYVCSNSLDVDFVLETVNQLVNRHGISLQQETLIHSDQGVHYTSLKFIQLVNDSNLRQSMSRKANCWDNAPQESFFGHMKDEIDLRHCETHEQVAARIDDWADYYNNERYQWGLAHLSPNEFYQYCLSGEYPLPIAPPMSKPN
jgi:transposase InsO family protein